MVADQPELTIDHGNDDAFVAGLYACLWAAVRVGGIKFDGENLYVFLPFRVGVSAKVTVQNRKPTGLESVGFSCNSRTTYLVAAGV